MCLIQTEGRQLPLEKIILGSTSFQSSPQADWGQQAVKEQVITPVPLRNWMVLYVNRDKSKALDFVTMMNKVTPAMGIEVSVLPSATSKVITSHYPCLMSLFLNKTHHTKQRQRTTQVGINGGALPCVRLACATSGYCVTNEPHLSPQHYELNAKQHMLDRTRVSVSR